VVGNTVTELKELKRLCHLTPHVCVESNGTRQGLVVGAYKHCKETSSSIKGRKCEQVNNYQLLKEASDPCNYLSLKVTIQYKRIYYL
jgi:hypothetical protein